MLYGACTSIDAVFWLQARDLCSYTWMMDRDEPAVVTGHSSVAEHLTSKIRSAMLEPWHRCRAGEHPKRNVAMDDSRGGDPGTRGVEENLNQVTQRDHLL